MVHRRALLALAVPAVLAAALPAAAEPVPLDAISAYLNGLTTVEADFTQLNADGSQSTGKVFIRRPGRMRFEYAPPNDALVLASGGQVAIFDARSNQPPEQYPLRRTPLNLILARDIDLARARMVVDHYQQGPVTVVVAQDPEHPEYGTIALLFEAAPLALKQWVVTDEAGQQTTLLLGPLRTGANLGSAMFSIVLEAERRGF